LSERLQLGPQFQLKIRLTLRSDFEMLQMARKDQISRLKMRRVRKPPRHSVAELQATVLVLARRLKPLAPIIKLLPRDFEVPCQSIRQYNVRCAAPVGTQLYSVCQNPICPLALIQDCDAYLSSNLGPYRPISAITSSTAWFQYGPTAIASNAATSISSQTTTSRPSQATASNPSRGSSSKSLNTGAIAGIAVGSVALASILALAILFMLKRKKKSRSQELSAFNSSYTGARVDPHTDQVAKELKGVPVSGLTS
jgi:hypothetical protein